MRGPAGLRRVVLAGLLAVLATERVRTQDEALALQKQAVARLDAVVEHFRKTGNTRLPISELIQADTELAASNRALAARQDWSALAIGLIKQGHIRRMQGQWADAIPFYQQAHDAGTRSRDLARQGDALAWRALAESSRRNYGQALADATQAVRLAETTTDKDVLANALDILGTIQIAQLNLTGASDTLNREVTVAAGATNPMAAYFAYSNRSDVYLKLGQQCEHSRTYESCYQAFDRARADLEQSRSIVSRLGYAFLVQRAEQFIRSVETHRAMARSRESSDRVLATTAVFKPTKPTDVLVTDTFVPAPGAVPEPLVALYQASKRQERQLGAFAGISEARTQFLDGVMSEARGDNDAALGFYLKAADTLDRDRRSLRDERSRGTFAEDRINFYYAAVLQLLERRRYADAFELLERSRSRALADLLATRKLGLGRSEEQKLYAESALLRTEIADAQGRLFELANQPDAAANAAKISAAQNQIRALETRYQQVNSRMSVEAPRLQNLVNSTPAKLAALQHAIREERVEVIQYLVVEPGVIVWHIAPDSISVRNVFLPRSEVISKVNALRKTLTDPRGQFDAATAKELFLFVIQPVLSQIRSERLVIIPHGNLNDVPFQVLQNPADGRFLGERFQISYAPSASVLLGLRRSAGLSGGRLLAVADPGIPAAASEVAAIAKLFPGRSNVTTDPLARETDVKSMVRDVDVVHLSVHGKFDAAEPMLSYLALGPGGGDDGKLTAAEMFGLPLDTSRLVVLSACETGRSEVTHGNEIFGMVRSLIYAGAGTLVLSYWEVESDATAAWMRSFYENALTRPVPEAARAALVKLKSNPAYSHPYYWAAFAVIGR